MKQIDYKKLAAIGISGSIAGKRATDIFLEIDTRLTTLSKVCDKSTGELWKIYNARYKTSIDSPLDVLSQIENELRR
jgi:hypothetical protein